MRIVSWNKQKLKILAGPFAKMLDAVKADVVVVQETSGHLSADGWSFTQCDGGAQDTYTIGVRAPGTVRFALMLDDPRGGGRLEGGPRKFVVARVEYRGEKVTIATCHAPHDGGAKAESSDAAKDYMRRLALLVSGGSIRKPPKGLRASAGVQQTEKRGRVRSPSMGAIELPAPNAVVPDIFLGDTNLYTDSDANAAFEEWTVLQIGYTTGHKGRGDRGSPLDRIAIRPSWDVVLRRQYDYGRILSPGINPAGLRGQEAPRDGAGLRDLRLTASGNPYSKSPDPVDLWGSADHLAIYFDTRRDHALANAAVANAAVANADADIASPELEVRALRNRTLPNKRDRGDAK